MARRSHITDKTLSQALKSALGNISLAARNLGIDRSTIYLRILKNDKLQQIITDARESMVDNAESALHRAVTNGEGWAVCFTLKTQGKNRGYVERQEVQQESRVQVTVNPAELTDEQLAAIAFGETAASS